MKKRREEKINNIAYGILTVISVMLLVWFFASWADTITHNMPGDSDYGQYAKWSVFTLMEEAAEK